MKRLSVVVLLVLVTSILFSSNAVADYISAKSTDKCNKLLNEVINLPPGSPKLDKLLEQASRFNCGTVMDRIALLALYYRTRGDGWGNNANWLTNPDHCTWYGVSCLKGRVDSVSFYANNLIGSIPPELGYLSNLTSLFLPNNRLSGYIPPELGNLSKLRSLILFHNETLSGPIPPELSKLSNLRILLLYGNDLSGSIPPELGNLSNLTYLHLYFNHLCGSIPPELGNLSNLTSLVLFNNQLSGSIPPELGKLSNLTTLSLENNQLTGSIPPELGNLANLDIISLSNNQLSGPIPPELGNLPVSSYLSFSNNQLSGQVPSSFSNYSSEIHRYMIINLFGDGNGDLCIPAEVYSVLLSQPTDFLEQYICIQKN